MPGPCIVPCFSAGSYRHYTGPPAVVTIKEKRRVGYLYMKRFHLCAPLAVPPDKNSGPTSTREIDRRSSSGENAHQVIVQLSKLSRFPHSDPLHIVEYGGQISEKQAWDTVALPS